MDSVANIRGRSRSGMLRPIATYAMGGIVPAPRPWMKRAAMSTGMLGARPPISRPIPNSASPSANGRPRAPRSTVPPTTAIPISEPRKNAEKTQPYSSLPPSSFATIGRTVEIARASNATSVMVRTRPPLRTRRFGDHSPSWAAAGEDCIVEGCRVGANRAGRAGAGHRAVGPTARRVRSRRGAPRPGPAHRCRRP